MEMGMPSTRCSGLKPLSNTIVKLWIYCNKNYEYILWIKGGKNIIENIDRLIRFGISKKKQNQINRAITRMTITLKIERS